MPVLSGFVLDTPKMRLLDFSRFVRPSLEDKAVSGEEG